MKTDNRAVSRWETANRAWKQYRLYIKGKTSPFALTFTDLVYVSNFKGGNAVVAPTDAEMNGSLRLLVKQMKTMNTFLDGISSLAGLPQGRLDKFIGLAQDFCDAAAAPLSGFGVSYRSTLLHFHFPETVPILDRRILHGAGIVDPDDKTVVDTNGQIKDLITFYPELIKRCRTRLCTGVPKSLRKLDRMWFIKPLKKK